MRTSDRHPNGRARTPRRPKRRRDERAADHVNGTLKEASGRISQFAMAVGLVTLVGVLAIPVISAVAGTAATGTLFTVQATAQLGAILVAFGWGAAGAATVAGMPEADRAEYFRQSLRARLVLYAVTAPVLAVLLWALTRGDLAVSIVGAFAYLLPAVGGNWYFAGRSEPLRLFRFDTIPAICGTLLGIAGVWWTHELWVFCLGQGLGYLAAAVITAVVVLRGAPRSERIPSLRDTLSAQRAAVLATATTGLYVNLPVIAVGAFFPRETVAVFGMANTLFRYCTLAFQPFQQFFQGWVPADRDQLAHRARVSALAALGIGAFAGVCIAVLSPPVSSLLLVGKAHVPYEISIPFGVAFVGVAVSAVVGYASLVALGRVTVLAVSTLIGAAVGAPLVILFAALGHAPAVAWAVAVSELCVAGYQVYSLRRRLTPVRDEEVKGARKDEE